MTEVIVVIAVTALTMATSLSMEGYNLNRGFSPSSLWEIDRFFEEQSDNGQAKSGLSYFSGCRAPSSGFGCFCMFESCKTM